MAEVTGGGEVAAGSTRAFSAFSFDPLTPAEPMVADAPDVVPELRPHETDVWLSQWQIAEEEIIFEEGEEVRWALIPMDEAWTKRLFGNRRAIHLQLDTYAAATRGSDDPSWTRLVGGIARIDQVSMPRQQAVPTDHAAEEQGLQLGEAIQHQVTSLQTSRAHDGDVVGWVVRVRSRLVSE
ncbi:hypothetical protein [Planctomonas deserti]|uniref:hypothetical protein n=1 Tax=Planctomonas deserti TaxID=2144185 RepID=UPI000D34ABAB|nr:hypothetical protein [Planctomonas deserti]